MKNTYTRHKTNASGQLNSLEARMSDKAYERRTAKIAMRVGRDGAMTRGAFVSFVQMGFWQRLSWLFRGIKAA